MRQAEGKAYRRQIEKNNRDAFLRDRRATNRLNARRRRTGGGPPPVDDQEETDPNIFV